MKKSTIALVVAGIFSGGLIQCAQKKQDITLINKSSYDMHVGLAGESNDKLRALGIGRQDREIVVPMIVRNEGEWDRVDLKVRVALIENKHGDNYIKKINKNIPLYAPKGSFSDLKSIAINYSKIFTLEKNGKFTLKFNPSDLGISYRK